MIFILFKKSLRGTNSKYLALTNTVKCDIMYVSKEFLISHLFVPISPFHNTILQFL